MTEELAHPMAVFLAHDEEDLELYSHAIGYKLILFDLTERLRSDYKYTALDEETKKYVETLKDYISDLKVQYHLPED